MRVKITNNGNEKSSPVTLYSANSDSWLVGDGSQKKYSVLRDQIYNPPASEMGGGIVAGQTVEQFAQFAAPPLTIRGLLHRTGASPTADVPVLQ